MTYLQALVIAIIQGATELFPVSSLGHAVILPQLLGWSLDQHAPAFLPFLVLLHLGTATALLLYFWHDWWALLVGVLGLSDAHRVRESRHIALLLIIATVPAVILGAGLEHMLRRLFGTPLVACGFLVANGVLLIVAEQLRGRATASEPRAVATMTAVDAIMVGLWQCLALLPGISRSGATIVGGLLRGIDHAGAAHFSFLIAPPIILGATVLEVWKLLHANVPPGTLQTAGIAAVVAGVVAFASTAFLMRYFRQHEKWALNPFGYYCILAGGGAAAWLVIA
jgi:undecaprenyl-diphosphatase